MHGQRYGLNVRVTKNMAGKQQSMVSVVFVSSCVDHDGKDLKPTEGNPAETPSVVQLEEMLQDET